ncbi:MAG: M48 family metalloprotease [Planctomycetota bacterium]
MKKLVLGVVFLALCSPAYAQFGGLLNRAQQAKKAKDALDSLNISEEEEIQLGAAVSLKVRTRFGVVQDPAVHRYVTLLGMAIAEQTERPKLPWQFIVLDTDGVNAFASPGGFVHITRGALGLIENEAELAAVLSHEIGHVAHNHTVNAIRKGNAQRLMSDAVLADRGPFLDSLANLAYDMVLEGTFDRGDELDSDKYSVSTTQKLGYSSGALADFLTRLDERNKDQPARNGLFASHPEMKERIQKIRQMAGSKTGATGEPRYAAHIKYEAADVSTIAVVVDGAAGLTGSSKESGGKDDKEAKKAEPKKEEPKRGFGLGALRRATGAEDQTAQVSASGGSRGVGPDRAAKGGDNPAIVETTVTAAEVAAFKKGIA